MQLASDPFEMREILLPPCSLSENYIYILLYINLTRLLN